MINIYIIKDMKFLKKLSFFIVRPIQAYFSSAKTSRQVSVGYLTKLLRYYDSKILWYVKDQDKSFS